MQAPLIGAWILFWLTLMRGLFVRARILPPTCARCGLPLERRRLGDRVCGCHAD